MKRVNSLPSGRLTIKVTGRLASAVGCIVAQQRHELHRLAGAVDAALGIEEGVDRAGLRASIDAAIRQVESRLGELEPREFLLGRIRGHDGDRFGRTGALDKARGERGAPVGAGDDLADRLVAAREQHVTSMPASGWAVWSERANTLKPSSPLKVVSPISVSITHRPAAPPLVVSSSS